MLCFEVWINGKKERVVGCKSAEEYGVYVSTYPEIDSEAASLEMSGYSRSEQTHPDELRWGMSELQPNDEVLIRVVRTEAVDPATISKYGEGEMGDNRKAMICSNCRRSHLEIEGMITAQRIRLCSECARTIVALVVADET